MRAWDWRAVCCDTCFVGSRQPGAALLWLWVSPWVVAMPPAAHRGSCWSSSTRFSPEKIISPHFDFFPQVLFLFVVAYVFTDRESDGILLCFCSETRDCKGFSFSFLMQHQTKATFLFRSQSGCLCSAAQPCKLVFWAEESEVTAFSYTKAFSAVKTFHKSCLGTCLVLRNMNLVAHRCQCAEFNDWLHFYKIKDMVLNFEVTISP